MTAHSLKQYNELAARLARLETLLESNDALSPPGAVTLADMDLGPGVDLSIPDYSQYLSQRTDPSIVWNAETLGASDQFMRDEQEQNYGFGPTDSTITDLMQRIQDLELFVAGGSKDTNQDGAEDAGAEVGDDGATGTGTPPAATASSLGLGTMAYLSSPLGLANGGTSGTTAATARTGLGLGTIATQDSNNVSITAGTISGMTGVTVSGTTGVNSSNTSATNTIDGPLRTNHNTYLSVAGAGAKDFVIGDSTASISADGTYSRLVVTGVGSASTTFNSAILSVCGPAYSGFTVPSIQMDLTSTTSKTTVTAKSITINASGTAVGEYLALSSGERISLSGGSAGIGIVCASGGVTSIETAFYANNTGLSFFSNSPTSKGTVTGSRGGNVALANLLSVLSAYGLITNSTT